MPIFSASAKWTIRKGSFGATNEVRENFLEKIRRARFLDSVPFWETVGIGGYPRLPPISGIIELAENRKVIYGLQQLTGKILSPLGLQAEIRLSPEPQFSRYTAFAVVMICYFNFARKVRCHIVLWISVSEVLERVKPARLKPTSDFN